MKTVQTTLTSEPDGKLHLEIPVAKAGQIYRVTVTVDEASDAGWPDEYFDSIVGKWDGDFIVEPEGDFEKRESL